MGSSAPSGSGSENPAELRASIREAFLWIIDKPTYRRALYGKDLPPMLSHYTDAGGAAGIIGNGEFWASHALFMNDAKELRLVRPLFEQLVEDTLPQRVADSGARQTIAEALWESFDLIADDPGIYVICFSTHDDQLGQWRGYGFAGGGYSISYATNAFIRLLDGRRDLHLVPVIYDKARQLKVAERQFDQLVRVLMQRFDTLDEADKKHRLLRRLGYAIGEFANAFAYRFKDPAFAEENEWRLIYQTNSNECGDLKREFRESGGRLLPFVRLPVSAGESDLALAGLLPATVRVGPTANPQVAELAIQYLLADAGLPDVEVLRSTIPLRA